MMLRQSQQSNTSPNPSAPGIQTGRRPRPSKAPPVVGKIIPSGTSPFGCRSFPVSEEFELLSSVGPGLVQPFFARMRNMTIRPSFPSFCSSQTDAQVNGWEANLDRYGMQTKKCWPGAQVRRLEMRFEIVGVSSTNQSRLFFIIVDDQTL